MTVELWSSSRGVGDPFVMLHPGGVDSRALDQVAERFADRYEVITPDQRGHGRTPDAPGPMTFDILAADTIAFIEGQVGRPVIMLGYSDGASIALLVALRRPDLVRALVFVSGVFHGDGWLPGVLDGATPEFMIDMYAQVSPDGRGHFAEVEAKTQAMHDGPRLDIGNLGSLAVPALLIFGDDDEVRPEHSIAMLRAIPRAELAIVPHASHGVLVEKLDLCARMIDDFLEDDRPATFAPIRRRPA